MRFFDDCLEGRYAGFDAAGYTGVEHTRVCVEMSRAARDPDFHQAAFFIIAVSDKMSSSTCHAEESGGEPLDIDGRIVPCTWNREGLAVLAAEDVEDV